MRHSIIIELLEKGANPHVIDIFGKTAYDNFKEKPELNKLNEKEKKEIEEAFIKAMEENPFKAVSSSEETLYYNDENIIRICCSIK